MRNDEFDRIQRKHGDVGDFLRGDFGAQRSRFGLELLPRGSFDHDSAAHSADLEGGVGSYEKRTLDENIGDVNPIEAGGFYGNGVRAWKQRFQAIAPG